MAITWGEIYDLGLTWGDVDKLNLTWSNLSEMSIADLVKLSLEKLERFKLISENLKISDGMEKRIESLCISVNISNADIPKQDRKWTKILIEKFIETIIALIIANALPQLMPLLIDALKKMLQYIEIIITK